MLAHFSSVNDCDSNETEKERGAKTGHSVKLQSNGSAPGKWYNVKDNSSATVNGQRERKNRQSNKTSIESIAAEQQKQDEYCQRSLYTLHEPTSIIELLKVTW